MPSSVISSFRGPCVVVCIGGSVAIVGMVPVAITMSLGVRSSATIIGVGFIGFGLLIVLPGLCWCIVIQLHNCRVWRHSRRQQLSSSASGHDETSSLDIIRSKHTYGGTSHKRMEEEEDVGTSSLFRPPDHPTTSNDPFSTATDERLTNANR